MNASSTRPPASWTKAQACAQAESDRARGARPAYPFGSQMTGRDQRLDPALTEAAGQTRSPVKRLALSLSALLSPADPAPYQRHLQRLSLDRPANLKEQILRKPPRANLARTAKQAPAQGAQAPSRDIAQALQ